jgi:hypothetical protein
LPHVKAEEPIPEPTERVLRPALSEQIGGEEWMAPGQPLAQQHPEPMAQAP